MHHEPDDTIPSRLRDTCGECGYDLRGTQKISARCPECGRTNSEAWTQERFALLATTALVLAFLSLFALACTGGLSAGLSLISLCLGLWARRRALRLKSPPSSIRTANGAIGLSLLILAISGFLLGCVLLIGAG